MGTVQDNQSDCKTCITCNTSKPITDYPSYNLNRRKPIIKCKDCLKQYHRKYYQEHREEMIASFTAYNQEHKQEIREYNLKYHAIHKDKLRARNTEYVRRIRREAKAQSKNDQS